MAKFLHRVVIYLLVSLLVYIVSILYGYLGVDLTRLAFSWLENFAFMGDTMNIRGLIRIFFTLVISEYLLLDNSPMGMVNPTAHSANSTSTPSSVTPGNPGEGSGNSTSTTTPASTLVNYAGSSTPYPYDRNEEHHNSHIDRVKWMEKVDDADRALTHTIDILAEMAEGDATRKELDNQDRYERVAAREFRKVLEGYDKADENFKKARESDTNFLNSASKNNNDAWEYKEEEDQE